MKLNLRLGISAVTGLFILGVALAWSGLINVAASSGHWMITDWFLHWVMRNSVRAQAAMTVDEPSTDSTGLVSAAGHYAVNCAPCHGAPGEHRSTVMQAATPPPPDLGVTAKTYDGAQLFWIIKHGVKFTAMPAWPAQERDDEVRRMAGFVQRLPGMTAAEYRELAYGTGRIFGGAAVRLEDAVADCERCHADNGRAQPDIPVLAGQKPEYLRAALEEYATSRRPSAVMRAAAARVDDELRQSLAEHYARLPGLARDESAGIRAPSTADSLAASIVMKGLPELDLPACSKCHSPGKEARYPVIAGQKAEYLAARLRRWQSGEQIVEARKSTLTMPMMARRIPKNMIEPLAQHFAQQDPSSGLADERR